MNNKTTSNKAIVVRVIFAIILAICSLIVIYPLIYAVGAAFNPKAMFTADTINPFPDGFSVEQFVTLFMGSSRHPDANFLLWFKNTLFLAICSSLLSVIVCSLAAYVFSRFKFPMRKAMMISLLILQVFPSFIGMMAIYVIVFRIGLYDNLFGLVLIYVAGNVPYNTWLVKSYLDTIPKSLDEAARIDGANHLTIFFRVILPIARPIIGFLALTTFTGPWMDYIYPSMILTNDENKTIALGLLSYVAENKNDFALFAAGALIVSVPFVIFFIISQKSLTTGLGAAAVKE